VPRTVECELSNDLVDVCVPGDVVSVCGVVKVVAAAGEGGGTPILLSVAGRTPWFLTA
jgi:DNA helicase MCM8